MATGFGLELGYNPEQVHFPGSYWRNDMLGQPALAGATSTYLVSGYGDGAIVDLCRLTIERFRQDVILEELFGSAGLDETEDLLRPLIRSSSSASGINVKTLIENSEDKLLEFITAASKRLSYRIRKDTTVILHAKGTGASLHSIGKLFESKTSVANRLLLYMLYRAGAFLVRFQEMENVKLEFAVPSSGVIRRHGTSAKDAVLALFADQSVVVSELDDMKERDEQSTDRLYPLGSFPPVPEGAKP